MAPLSVLHAGGLALQGGQCQLRHLEQADPEYAKRVELALAALQR